jgi:hypothetical protein
VPECHLAYRLRSCLYAASRTRLRSCRNATSEAMLECRPPCSPMLCPNAASRSNAAYILVRGVPVAASGARSRARMPFPEVRLECRLRTRARMPPPRSCPSAASGTRSRLCRVCRPRVRNRAHMPLCEVLPECCLRTCRDLARWRLEDCAPYLRCTRTHTT